MRRSWSSNHRASLGPQLAWRLERLDLALLRLDEGKREPDRGDDISRAGRVGRPDPVELRSVDPTDRRHLREILGPGRLGSRVRR